jgi:hypothetical protein
VKAIVISRRQLVAAGTIALAGASGSSGPASAQTQLKRDAAIEEIVRRYYKAWETKDWRAVEPLLADNFTFSSAAGDDHLNKTVFKSSCWDSQKDYIDHFDIERLFIQGQEAFVRYLCHTKNGKSFRNVEYVRVAQVKVEAIECYFGGNASFPSAVSTGKL